MSAVSRFADWYNLTREAVLSGPEDIINEVSLNSYTLGRFLMNRPARQVVRKGKHIVEFARLTSASNFAAYAPGDPVTTSRGPTKQQMTFGWRFGRNHIPVTEDELDFNDGDELTAFKDFEASEMQDLYADHFDGLEGWLWKRPDSTKMETAATERGLPFSIPAMISENSTTYLPPSTVWSASTCAGINPATYTNWRPQIVTYTSGDLFNVNTGILAGLDQLDRKCSFQVPQGVPGAAKAFTRLGGPDKVLYFTNGNGLDIYARLLRAANDTLSGMGSDKSDPAYPNRRFNNRELIWASKLDSELLEESAGAYTGNAYPDGKPRFFRVDGRVAFPVFHENRFMRFQDKDGGSIQPDTTVMFLSSRWQFVFRSRKRHGILKPA